MGAVAADTHALIWYMVRPDNLSALALDALDVATAAGDPIFCSAISQVEIIYLVEKGRLPASSLDLLVRAERAAGAVVVPLSMEIAEALRRIPRGEVPDMPDRIIAATALHLGVPLVSRDGRIRASSVQTIW